MKKANQTQETPAAVVNAPAQYMRDMAAFFQFPIDMEARQAQEKRNSLNNLCERNALRIEDQKRSIVIMQRERKEALLELEQMAKETEEIAPPTVEQVAEQLAALGKLPWIEKVEINGEQVRVYTRKGMLKTVLTTRLVDCGKGTSRTEYMEPITVPMPRYELNFGIHRAYEKSWAMNPNKLAIRLADTYDASKFVGGKIVQHQPYPHWACGDGRDFGSWSGLCLGEYEEDIDAAAKQGLVPFFTTLATYLQTCGDSHAYMTKAVWAARMGNPEYADFCVRPMEKSETTAILEERYKRDFRTMNQMEGIEPPVPSESEQPGTVRRQSIEEIYNAIMPGQARGWVQPRPFVQGTGEAIPYNTGTVTIGTMTNEEAELEAWLGDGDGDDEEEDML